jgi:hypothetical protein
MVLDTGLRPEFFVVRGTAHGAPPVLEGPPELQEIKNPSS